MRKEERRVIKLVVRGKLINWEVELKLKEDKEMKRKRGKKRYKKADEKIKRNDENIREE